jgi:hypothetical protein
MADANSISDAPSIKKEKLPRLRTHKRTGDNGQLWISYWYDMRGKGIPDIPLGTDRTIALEKWKILKDGGSLAYYADKELEKIRNEVWIKVPTTLPVKRRGEIRTFRGFEWVGMPDWARALYLGAESRHKKHGTQKFIDLKDFRDLIIRADGMCEVSGLKMIYTGQGKNPFSPSIDRIDSSMGYVKGNVRLVCLIANLGMSQWGLEPFKILAKAISEKHSN